MCFIIGKSARIFKCTILGFGLCCNAFILFLYSFLQKGIYFFDEKYILFGQKVYTFFQGSN